MKKSRTVLSGALVALFASGIVVPAYADPLAAPLGTPPIEAAPAASSAHEAPVTFAAADPDDGLVTGSATTEVAPGLDLTQFDRFDPAGWIRGDTLAVDLGSKVLKPTYLSPARSPRARRSRSRSRALARSPA